MSNDNTALASGEIPDDEKQQRQESAVETAVANLVKRERENFETEIVRAIQQLEDQTDRSQVPDFEGAVEYVNRRGQAVTKQRSPTEPIYRRMSEEEREWRGPDADHWYAEWIRGDLHNDRAAKLQAEAKLDGIFGRATTQEGAAGASGALSAGTGGSIIPRPLENVVMIARDRIAKMRRFAKIFQMTRQQHTIPTAAAMTAAMVGEGTSAAQGEPTFASVALIAKTGSVHAVASKEVLDDAAVNLVDVFATRGGGALGVLEDDQAFKDGDGTGNNITKVDGTAYAETTTGTLAYADVLSMYYNVAQEYRDMGRWLVASNVLEMLSNVRDGNGRPFYQGLTDTPGPITDDSGQVGSILRRPVFEVPFADGEILFGDVGALYAFGSRQGIEIDVSEHARFQNREIVWLLTQRFGGINVDTVAAQHAKGITSATSA